MEEQLVVPTDPRLQVYREVWLVNEMDHDFSEKVNGDQYFIPAKGKKRMRRHEAVKVRGNFPGDGIEKRLKIIPIFPTASDAGIMFESPVDGSKFKTKEELDQYHAKLRKQLSSK